MQKAKTSCSRRFSGNRFRTSSTINFLDPLKVSLSKAFAGVEVGIKEMEDGIWVVSFLDYDLGYFDDKSRKVEPIEDPFSMGKV